MYQIFVCGCDFKNTLHCPFLLLAFLSNSVSFGMMIRQHLDFPKKHWMVETRGKLECKIKSACNEVYPLIKTLIQTTLESNHSWNHNESRNEMS